MENKKSSNVVLVILFTLLIMLFVGYLIYDRIFDNNFKKSNSTEPIIEKDYDLIEAKNLIDKYYLPSAFEYGYTNDIMNYLAYKNLNENQIKEINCDDIYDNLKNEDKVYYIENLGFCNETAENISYNNMNYSYKKLFGKDIQKESFKYSIIPFDYNEENNTFVKLSSNMGITDFLEHYIYGIKSAKEKNDVLTINVGFYKLKLLNDQSSYYTNFDEYITYTFEQVKESNFDEKFFEQYSNYMDTYTFTFMKENNEYILSNMIKILK